MANVDVLLAGLSKLANRARACTACVHPAALNTSSESLQTLSSALEMARVFA